MDTNHSTTSLWNRTSLQATRIQWLQEFEISLNCQSLASEATAQHHSKSLSALLREERREQMGCLEVKEKWNVGK
ncbi:hypothetical protein ACFX2J_032205 [Malus domestica]